MRTTSDLLAIDLGAASGRVFLGAWDGAKIELSELHRFTHTPVRVLGHLHWDVLHLWTGIKYGLSRYAFDYGSKPKGIGVDAWGVDFALLDSSGQLLKNPYSYRDSRTDDCLSSAFERVREHELFYETGIQCWKINSLFQLFSMVKNKDPQLKVVATLLMIPDLFSFWLSGEKTTEYTIARTSQMLRHGKGGWAQTVLRRLEIPCGILPPLASPATFLPPLRRDVANETGLSAQVPVLLVASHDTASAVAAIPGMDSQSVFISSGTWSLVGIETKEPVLTERALQFGFSNEESATGSVLLLRNAAGLWPLQECLRLWRYQGHFYNWDELLRMVQQSEPFQSLIDPDAADFLAPEDMLFAIRSFCQRTKQPVPDTPSAVARCCIESLSFRYREVVESLEEVTNRKLSTIRMVGGGCQNGILCQLTADTTGRVVVTGPVEASALGNIMVQAIARGYIANIQQGRCVISASVAQVTYEPQVNQECEHAYQRFLDNCGGSGRRAKLFASS